MPIVLLCCDYFLPGFKAGGPIHSISGIVECLGDDLSFRIITRDRDLGDQEPYSNILQGEWNPVGKAWVRYLSEANRFKECIHLLNTMNYDILYLNSFFSPRFSILPLLLMRIGLVKSVPIIIAPRGEFSPGHLSLKPVKYFIYIGAAKILKLYRNVIWHASTEDERANIVRIFGQSARVWVASDIASYPAGESNDTAFCVKRPGELKAIFLGRMAPQKNLRFALELLSGLKGNIVLDIYGPVDNSKYWNVCRNVIREIPTNVKVHYWGEIPHSDVYGCFSEHHVFLFPTLGENFGHVIIESLSAGCPVLISDQTPWCNLKAEGVGWDISLGKKELFRSKIVELLDMDQEKFNELSSNARGFARRKLSDPDVIKMNKALFTIDGGAQESEGA